MIRVDGLTKTFEAGELTVLEDVSFTVDRGASLAVIGPSGCGKTTLLYLLAGLSQPSAGVITIGGRRASASGGSAVNTAFILQDYGLLPWKTVWQNVCLGMKIRRLAAEEREARAAALLAQLGLTHHRDTFPARLSGGEKQRVAIARALATRPEILLMDEPFSALDTLTRERLQALLMGLWRAHGLTLIIVTHSIEEAVFLGGTIMVMDRHPGRIKALIDNPGAGESTFRERDAYFHRCREVRRQVEQAWI